MFSSSFSYISIPLLKHQAELVQSVLLSDPCTRMQKQSLLIVPCFSMSRMSLPEIRCRCTRFEIVENFGDLSDVGVRQQWSRGLLER